MSNKHYVANNTKYYKDSNAQGEMGHVDRLFNKDKNAFSSLSKNNFGHTFDNESLNLHQNYLIKLNEAKTQSPRAIQKHSNTFIDSVLVFDNELMFNLLSSPDGRKQVEESIKDYMTDFQKTYGFEPIGFQFHMDEGTFFTQKQFDEEKNEELKKRLVPTVDDETGESGYIKQNFHAQAIFLNFDKSTGKSCLRAMKREDWSNSQDLLHKHFKKFGFDRGEYKQTNSRDHKNKSDYVKNLEIEVEELKVKEKDLLLKAREKGIEYGSLMDEIGGVYDKANDYDDIRFKTVKMLSNVFKNEKLVSFLNVVKDKLKTSQLYPQLEEFKDYFLDKFKIKDSDFIPQDKNKKVEKNDNGFREIEIDCDDIAEDIKEFVDERKEKINETMNDLKIEVDEIEKENEKRIKNLNNKRSASRRNRI